MSLLFVTETTTANAAGKYVMCTQMAAVMAANAANPAIPATVAEGRRLYGLSAHVASGATTQVQLMAEIKAAWDLTPKPAASYGAALNALAAGSALIVAGDYGALPPNLYRWDVHYATYSKDPNSRGHEAAVGPVSPTNAGMVWWRDPLGHGSYVGEWVPWATVTKFAYSPANILILDPEAAMKFTPYTPSDVAPGSIATLQTATGAPASSMKDVDKRIRMFRTDTGAEVIPNSPTYPVGLSGMAGPPHPEASFVVSQSGIDSPVILLKRNTVVTPAAATPAADRSYLVHFNVPGDAAVVPTITKA
jgi:hypothetical protein